MKRREFVEKIGIGSAGILAAGALAPESAAGAQHQNHSQVDGPLASATVSFGQWMTTPALDRFPNESPRLANQHLLIPYVATVKAGGSITFVIAGFHQVLVYAPGTTLASIDKTVLVPSGTGFPPLVADPTDRIYRGINPVATLPSTDRVETISIATPGIYLVVCGVLPHFDEGMHGFLKVIP